MNIGKCGAFFLIEKNKNPRVAFLSYNNVKEDKYLAGMAITSQTKSGSFKSDSGSMYSPKKEFIENLEKMKSEFKLFDYKKYTPEKMNKIAKQMNAPFPETFFTDAYKGLKKIKTCTRKRK
jgi:hypothetical protein